ncbi:neutral ceramidase [Strongylocentrotus purpuratus]|uniref:Neutral ceramidase n=1 Tax=Strongylocentrotus purpuratus TaxID=7668 RepID=A0A7M7NFU1_STRPU|nr:neutral ceramidase [Strongylocentrotus purpuratus]
MSSTLFFILVMVCFVSGSLSQDANYILGAGIADITGPAADANLMGYANPSQTAGGISIRQFSRAFVIADSKGEKRFVFVSIDAGMQDQGVTLEVISRLKTAYGGLYNETNVAISGTHSHSGTAGFLQFVLFDVTSLGFIKETFEVMVAGIVKSIESAHESMVPGNIYHNEGILLDSNINRSPTAYENNPKEEQARYKYNVDKLMTVLKLVDTNGADIGMINWFAVHGTCMNNTNKLISGDNKGYASQLMEKHFNPGALPGKGKFVAAFASSNLGDVSPNTKGARCIDTGLPCDRNSSTCGGKTEMCIAFGPGEDMFDSTRIIGENQYKKAMELYSVASRMLTGPIGFVHQYVNMTDVTVHYNSSFKGKTCKPSMGYSFAAGTTDGPGAFDFTQGVTEGNLFWNLVRNALKKPSPELIACQHPKPILLATGEMNFPYEWSPHIVDTQILRIGDFAILAIPGEFTTMSGRRVREAVTKEMIANGASANATAVVAGLTNTYSDYIVTYEEYQVQRYEGASTIFGQHTLQAYINQFRNLTTNMMQDKTPPRGPIPKSLIDDQVSFLPPVFFDETPIGKSFGEVLTDVSGTTFKKGSVVQAVFQAGNPRNNLRTGESFMTVEYLDPTKQTWTVVHTDADFCTRFIWTRTSTLLGHSEVTAYWDIPLDTPMGTYRLRVFGESKDIAQKISSYEGTSSQFKVTQ